jgi:hypothetical protein
MKNSVKSLLVAAAVTGLLGVTAVPFAAADDKATTDKAATAQTTEQKDAAKADKDKHSCKGANGCSGKDAKAKKASSKEKSKDAAAKDKNSCKAANGCSGKTEEKPN